MFSQLTDMSLLSSVYIEYTPCKSRKFDEQNDSLEVFVSATNVYIYFYICRYKVILSKTSDWAPWIWY